MGGPSVTASGEVLSIKLDAGTDAALKKVAIKTGKTKVTLVRDAVRHLIEEEGDYAQVLAFRKKRGRTLSHEQLKKSLGLDR